MFLQQRHVIINTKLGLLNYPISLSMKEELKSSYVMHIIEIILITIHYHQAAGEEIKARENVGGA